MTDTKLREAARAVVAHGEWGPTTLQLDALRAALDEPPEQAPEPTEGETGAEIGATEQAWIDADRFMREMAEVMTDEPLCPICDSHGCSACVHGVTALAIGEVYAAGFKAGRDHVAHDVLGVDDGEPTEGDTETARWILRRLNVPVGSADECDIDDIARALANARAQGEGTGVEAERAAVTGYLEALARSEQATDWSALDGLLLAAKDIEHALHTRGAHPAQKTSPNIPREDGKLESNIAILRLGIERDDRRLAGARDALHHYLCELDGEPCNCVECRATDKPRPE